ncbi:MAG: DoxX family protein [Hyphomicrobiales bacterium]|nr:DoxX family protein [Hyphomicrobiales bacterium]
MSNSKYFIPPLGGLYSGLDGFAELLLRVVVGLNLVPHGAQKLFGSFGGGGIGGTGQFLEQVGYTPGAFWALAIGVVEFFGGLAIAIGFLTRPAALAVTIFMAVAVMFHLGNGFFWVKGGYEYPVLWTVAAFYFLIRGAGRYSVDARIGREF